MNQTGLKTARLVIGAFNTYYPYIEYPESEILKDTECKHQ
jgi:hypothetical protein